MLSVIGLKRHNVIKIADLKDIEICKRLLSQLRPNYNFTINQLYLDDKKNGFTLLVKNKNTVIAISTFSIRKKKKDKLFIKALYWENLIVDKNHRDGVAYIEILGYLKKLIYSKKYDDIYFVVRRKKASKIHKAANFKLIGYIGLIFNDISFQLPQNQSNKLSNKLEVLTYKQFQQLLNNASAKNNFFLKNFNGFEMTEEDQICRQIYNKNGQIIINRKRNYIKFVRTIYKSFLLQINIIHDDNNFDISKNFEYFKQSIININLKLVKLLHKDKFFSIYNPILKYELLSLKKIINFKEFKFWEHDAW